VGVLWHPEEGEDLALFEALVREANEHRQSKRA
jgi:gamma-glutamyl-gamma-aminobutyrate hydrolase PuuD